MRSLACLWFELQMTQRYLREETFAPARVPPIAANLDAPTDIGALRRPSVTVIQHSKTALLHHSGSSYFSTNRRGRAA